MLNYLRSERPKGIEAVLNLVGIEPDMRDEE
jgi:hypothetical protein